MLFKNINLYFFNYLLFFFFLTDFFLNKYLNGFLFKRTGFFIYLDFFYLHFFIIFFINSIFFRFNMLLDIFGVDYSLKNKNIIELNYCFVNLFNNIRVFFKIFSMYSMPLPSLYFFFSSANWLEREVWDMYGVKFFLHKDLRRILTDYGFLGHPLLKDFPLVGYLECRYDDIFQVILYEPLSLSQNFRFFNFLNPWNYWK